MVRFRDAVRMPICNSSLDSDELASISALTGQECCMYASCQSLRVQDGKKDIILGYFHPIKCFLLKAAHILWPMYHSSHRGYNSFSSYKNTFIGSEYRIEYILHFFPNSRSESQENVCANDYRAVRSSISR